MSRARQRSLTTAGLLLTALAATAALPITSQAQSRTESDPISEDLLSAMEFRTLGPGFVTGRIQDIAIDPNNTDVWYVASAFGGLWKTVNRGISFDPIFDEPGVAFTLCCVVVDPSDSNVISSQRLPVSRL